MSVQRDGLDVVVQPLAEAASKPREPAHVHPHGEVLPLHVARRNEL